MQLTWYSFHKSLIFTLHCHEKETNVNIITTGLVCLIVGLGVGFIIAWRMQKKRLEAGFNKWTNIKTLNEYGNRLTAEVIDVKRINGTNKFLIKAVYQDPLTDTRYHFKKAVLVKDKSPAFIQRLQRITTVSVLVHHDTTPTNGLFWMERPW
jgi:hypothetical protein